MNKPAKIPVSPAYADDAYGWAMAQAALIRAGRQAEVDWENIAEEIEDMGRSEYRWVESSLRVLLLHLLKWDHQPEFRSRSWFLTVREQHRQFERGVRENPSLKSRLNEMRDEAYQQALVEAVAKTGLPIDRFPVEPLGWNRINNPAIDEADIAPR